MRTFTVALFLLTPAFAQTGAVTVDITPDHVANTFSPLRALGAGVDGVPTGTVDEVYTSANIPQMLSAGFGPLTYRLYTELSVQDWHWNPEGSYSGPGQVGYWVSSAKSTQPIAHTHGFNLPRSGFTYDQGTSSGYSRVDDGDSATFWKSNPYLSHAYTGDPDTGHPQWVMFDLGSLRPVNAIRINWANPYATQYKIQYWTGPDPLYSDNQGQWITLPNGIVTNGTGGVALIQLGSTPTNVEFVRVWMTAASGTCVETPAIDARDCMGYAVNEIGIGTVDANGTFVDLVHHSPDQNQTVTYCSSVDSWHTPALEEKGEEQAGLDLVFTSGITRGLPAVIPVTMLYGTPESAANELAYVESKGYNVGYVEMGEEPDGQFIVPEDYAALYVQWAKALHAVDPGLKLGGPVLESDYEVTAWPDASGNRSWLNRFFNYLKSHGAIDNLAFMSYEHYPYVPCEITWESLQGEPSYTANTLATWKQDGLPPGTPIFSTETNVAYDYDAHQVTLFGALWYSDFVGVFLSLGGSGAYYYEYEPLPLFPSSSGCNSWANYGMFVANAESKILEYDSQYFSAKLLTQQWADPVDAAHYVFPAATNLIAPSGAALVTSYALLRPDGKWSLLLINKDQTNPHPVTVNFQDSSNRSNHYFSGPVAQVSFGEPQYTWRPANADGYAQPDGPLETSAEAGGAGVTYNLEPGSITVLRGSIQ